MKFHVKIFNLDDASLDDHDPVPFFDKVSWVNLDKFLLVDAVAIRVVEMSIGGAFQSEGTFCIWGFMRGKKSQDGWMFVKVEFRHPGKESKVILGEDKNDRSM